MPDAVLLSIVMKLLELTPYFTALIVTDYWLVLAAVMKEMFGLDWAIWFLFDKVCFLSMALLYSCMFMFDFV